MKKLLLGLGTLAAVAAPAASVVACGNGVSDKRVLNGHAKTNIGGMDSERYGSLEYFVPTISPDIRDEMKKLSHFKFDNLGIQTARKIWAYDFDAQFTYKLTLNDQNETSPFYVLDLKDITLVDQDKVIKNINNTNTFISNNNKDIGLSEQDADAFTEFSYSSGDDKKYPQEFALANKIAIEIRDLNETKQHLEIFEKFKIALKGVYKEDVTSEVVEYLEKYVTNFTPVKPREKVDELDFDKSMIK